ncbi:hypothetical protein E2C01_079861 [Portunus trituberculatus]|uniref:Uncharacterized protein n=1 Tax=Portunus trituberculatus TaxID=210409 RepID=A0A5B7IMK9_PORTR|nr:hypothetical protein [Portunus trituberculatus]
MSVFVRPIGGDVRPSGLGHRRLISSEPASAPVMDEMVSCPGREREQAASIQCQCTPTPFPSLPSHSLPSATHGVK